MPVPQKPQATASKSAYSESIETMTAVWITSLKCSPSFLACRPTHAHRRDRFSARTICWDYLLRLSVCGARRELLQFGAEQVRLIEPDVDRRVRYLADLDIVVGARGLPAVI